MQSVHGSIIHLIFTYIYLTTSTVAGPFDLKRNVSFPVPRFPPPFLLLPDEGPIASEDEIRFS